MDTRDEFYVTEDGMRAVLETMRTMHQGMAELSHRLDAANEAIVILQYEIAAIRDHVPAGH